MDGMGVTRAQMIAQGDSSRGSQVRERLVAHIAPHEFSPKVKAELEKELDEGLVDWRLVDFKDKKDGPYLKGATVISQANRIFGVGNWSVFSVNDYKVVDYIEDGSHEYISFSQDVALILYGKFFAACTGVVNAKLAKKGGLGGRAKEVDKAVKGAETDGMKRAFRLLGKQFGSDLHKLGLRSHVDGAQRAPARPAADQAQGGARRGSAPGRSLASQPPAQPQAQGGAQRRPASGPSAPQPAQPQAQRPGTPQGRSSQPVAAQRGTAPQRPSAAPQPAASADSGMPPKGELISAFLRMAVQFEQVADEQFARDGWLEKFGFTLEDSDERLIADMTQKMAGQLDERRKEGARP